ncbi:MAG: SAM-dependent methyltransferase [Flavobacteriaceae bacterium]|nr:SAM-dependent methyltransferase [Flavobacteriaceae bacterium]|tara:strand:+ start:2624 stop:3802 length:1179 start_codon:yes stop_codon:yes gene_type:complete
MSAFSKALLRDEVQDYIHQFEGDSSALAFAGSPFPDITIQELLQQIEGRKRIETKLPSWYNSKGIIYPPRVHLEQTSSEVTANYKAALMKENTIIDITAGWGVDSFCFSKSSLETTSFEINARLAEISKHNATVLNAANLQVKQGNGLEEIASLDVDVIYVDPSRRHDRKGKVFFLEDCEPNVPEHLDYLLKRCDTLWVKTSPMLDLNVGIESLKKVTEIHVVAVKNEVKEVLWKIENTKNDLLQVVSINLLSSYSTPFKFLWNTESTSRYSTPMEYLYEPNAALMKSGAHRYLSEAFDLFKLAANTHLFTGAELIDFPGRTFKIIEQFPYSKKAMRSLNNLKKANITTRNFPESVVTIRKKWKLKEGGATYLFFTTLADGERTVIVCDKIS